MKYLKHFANAQEAATILATWPFNTISSIEGQSGVRYSEGVPVGPVVPTDRIVLKFMVTAEDWDEDAEKYKKCLVDDGRGDIPYDGSCFAYMIKDNKRIDTNFWSQSIYFDNTIGEHTVELVFNKEFDGNLPLQCFYHSEIDEVVIPSCVTSIDEEAFSRCTGLTSVTIPVGVTSIGSEAFRGCIGLTSVTIPDGVTSIGSEAFYNVRHIEYHGSATGSPWGAITMNGVTDGDFVFSDSTKHNLIAYLGTGGDVTIPSTVDTIGNSAFSGCSGLTSVAIPDAVTSIGHHAFYGCSGLTSVTIPESVTSIGHHAFQSCSGLTSVTIPNGVTTIGEGVFYRCSGLTSVTIPDAVTSIGEGAFNGCSGLTSVTIPDAVTSIGDNAFSGCSGLTSVTIGSGVTSIGIYAFYDCSGLTSVTIPNGVTSIGPNAFGYCSSLTSVTCLRETPPTLLNSNSFIRTNKCPIYVPASSVDAYKAATGWSEYASRIQAIQ